MFWGRGVNLGREGFLELGLQGEVGACPKLQKKVRLSGICTRTLVSLCALTTVSASVRGTQEYILRENSANRPHFPGHGSARDELLLVSSLRKVTMMSPIPIPLNACGPESNRCHVFIKTSIFAFARS